MSKIFPLRLSEEERASFQSAADKEGMKLSQWLRRAATRTASLEGALQKQAESESVVADKGEFNPEGAKEFKPWPAGQTTQEVKDRIYPQSRTKCPHRLNPGAWCKSCKRVK